MTANDREVERVARLLWRARERFLKEYGHYPTKWESLPEDVYLRLKYRAMARAILNDRQPKPPTRRGK